jgi:hypothetical protein
MSGLEELGAASWARRVLTETDSGREAVRALFYGLESGVAHAVAGVFDSPTCGNWECLSADQSWIGSLSPLTSSSRSRASSERPRT